MSKHPRAKKSLGQNFLTDPAVIERIISSVGPAPGQAIIEIGPGTGVLTQRLLALGATVTAIELDRDLIPLLRERFRSHENFSVIGSDALETDFRAFAPTAGQPLRLVANLPYYISTAILQRLIEFRDLFSDLTLMFQLEVVERITASPGSSERGYLTVMIEAYFDSAKLFDVPPTAFTPPPKVDSAVVRLTPRLDGVPDYEALKRVASLAFAHKRKTISNNLKAHFPNLEAALAACSIGERQRAEELTPDDWKRLVAALR